MPLDEVGEPAKLMPLTNHVIQAVAEEAGIRGGSRLFLFWGGGGDIFCSGRWSVLLLSIIQPGLSMF